MKRLYSRLMNKAPETTETATAQPEMRTLRAGFGAWDISTHPFGGDFIRPSKDLTLTNVRPSELKQGWMIGEAEYPPRRGTRTICFQSAHSQEAAQ